MRCYGMIAVTASKMSHIRPLVASVELVRGRFRTVYIGALWLIRSRRLSLRQAPRAFIVGSALILAFAVTTDAWAQARSSQPSARNRPADLPQSGHQTEAVDLNEGRSAAELFKAGCAVCHQSPAGLAKGRSNSELAGFLRQHYTSGTQHAATLAAFLASAPGGRGGPATASTPARINPNAPVDRPPAPVGREEEGRKPQEAARPPEREPAAKRKPERPVAARPAPAAPPPATAAATEAAAHTGDTPAAAPPAPPVEEKPAPPEIPL